MCSHPPKNKKLKPIDKKIIHLSVSTLLLAPDPTHPPCPLPHPIHKNKQNTYLCRMSVRAAVDVVDAGAAAAVPAAEVTTTTSPRMVQGMEEAHTIRKANGPGK